MWEFCVQITHMNLLKVRYIHTKFSASYKSQYVFHNNSSIEEFLIFLLDLQIQQFGIGLFFHIYLNTIFKTIDYIINPNK